jgi:hypothetical protein
MPFYKLTLLPPLRPLNKGAICSDFNLSAGDVRVLNQDYLYLYSELNSTIVADRDAGRINNGVCIAH